MIHSSRGISQKILSTHSLTPTLLYPSLSLSSHEKPFIISPYRRRHRSSPKPTSPSPVKTPSHSQQTLSDETLAAQTPSNAWNRNPHENPFSCAAQTSLIKNHNKTLLVIFISSQNPTITFNVYSSALLFHREPQQSHRHNIILKRKSALPLIGFW